MDGLRRRIQGGYARGGHVWSRSANHGAPRLRAEPNRPVLCSGTVASLWNTNLRQRFRLIWFSNRNGTNGTIVLSKELMISLIIPQYLFVISPLSLLRNHNRTGYLQCQYYVRHYRRHHATFAPSASAIRLATLGSLTLVDPMEQLGQDLSWQNTWWQFGRQTSPLNTAKPCCLHATFVVGSPDDFACRYLHMCCFHCISQSLAFEFSDL